MANLTESAFFEAGIYQLETGDPVMGGPDGIDNLQAKQLANRTKYLKAHVDALEAGQTVPPGIATEAFVNNLLELRDAKQSVRVATTAAISLTGTQTIDGVTVQVGDRVLVKNQAAGAENGIYVVAASAWSRAVDANESEDVTPGLTVMVEEGTALADTIWKLTTNAPITLGSTGLTFADITSGYAPLASPTFTGDPKAPTPAQFDNDTSIATTAHVQRALGNFSGNSIYNASGAIAVTDAGKRIISSAAGITLSLPLLSSVPVGTAFLIHAGAGGITIAPTAPDTFLAGNQAPATIAVKDGSTALMFAAPNNWVLESGDTLNAYSKFFDSVQSASGYQKLPSGLIIQWGATPTGNAAADVSVTFPIAFPTGLLNVVISQGYTAGSGSIGYAGAAQTGTTGFVFRSSGSGNQFRYVAIGY